MTVVQSPQSGCRNGETAPETPRGGLGEFRGRAPSPSSLGGGAEPGPRDPGNDTAVPGRKSSAGKATREKAGWFRVLVNQRSPHLEEGRTPGSRRVGAATPEPALRCPICSQASVTLANPPAGGRRGAIRESRAIGDDSSRYTIARGRKTNGNRPPRWLGNLRGVAVGKQKSGTSSPSSLPPMSARDPPTSAVLHGPPLLPHLIIMTPRSHPRTRGPPLPTAQPMPARHLFEASRRREGNPN